MAVGQDLGLRDEVLAGRPLSSRLDQDGLVSQTFSSDPRLTSNYGQ